MKNAIPWKIYFFTFIGYFLLGYSSLYFTTSTTVSPVWPASGFAIFCMLVWGFRIWPSIYLAAVIVDFITNMPLTTSMVMAISSALEAIVAVMVMGRIIDVKRLQPSHIRNLGLIFGSAVGALFGAAVGTGALYFFGVIKPEAILNSYLTWWTGDLIGAIFFAPIFLAFYQIESLQKIFTTQIVLKTCALIALVLAANSLLYFSSSGHYYIFVQFYLVLLAFLFLPNTAAYLISTLIYGLSLYACMKQLGPFHNASTHSGLMHTQLFFSGMSFTVMSLEVFSLNKRKFWPFIVLAIGWAAASGIYVTFVRGEELLESERLAKIADETTDAIEDKLNIYEAFLRAGKGFVSGHDGVSFVSWKLFTEELQLENKYRAINGLGFLERVPYVDIKSWEQKKQKDESADFRLHDVPGHPTVNQDERVVISYVEPLSRNKAAWGLILSTETNRKRGIYKSLETKSAALSSIIQLVQDNQKRPGFLYYLPVYKNNKHKGWVYAPFIAPNVFNVELGNGKGQIEYSVYYNESKDPAKLLFGDPGVVKNTAREAKVNFADAEFHIYFKKGPLFRSEQNLSAAWISMATALISLLFALIVANFQNLTEEANRIASEKTKALHENKALLLNSAKFTALGEMAGGIAHEINNPLAIIKGFSGQLEKMTGESRWQESDFKEKLGKISKTVDRIAAIIEGLRTFSRSGEDDEKEIVTINNIILLTLSFCEQRFYNAGIKIDKELLCQDSVLANGTQLSQVLLNLLNNAFDAIQSHPNQWIQIKSETVDGFAQIVITDSGPGIPPEIASKIMQPFFTTKPIGYGTGLGLSISIGIVESHMGSLTLDRSCPNTRFVLKIPLNKQS